MIKRIAVIFLLVFFCSVSFSNAEQIENKPSAQKQKTSIKKKTVKIKPGDVDPGDATVAGYEEDSERKYIIEDGSETYIFSTVEGASDNYGYFRVLWRFAYGREEKNKRDHLLYARLTAPPACLDHKRTDCGVQPLIKIGHLVVLYQGLGNYYISVYDSESSFYNSDFLVFNTVFLRTKKPNFADLDGDGYFETMGYDPISTKIADYKSSEAESQGNVLIIYRYKNGFSRIKGKSFEKYYMEHAQELIEKKYPEWFDKLNKTKSESLDRELKRRTVYSIIAAWLATVESTQTPELIKEALQRLKTLPYPAEEEKQKIVDNLIRYGYPMLKVN